MKNLEAILSSNFNFFLILTILRFKRNIRHFGHSLRVLESNTYLNRLLNIGFSRRQNSFYRWKNLHELRREIFATNRCWIVLVVGYRLRRFHCCSKFRYSSWVTTAEVSIKSRRAILCSSSNYSHKVGWVRPFTFYDSAQRENGETENTGRVRAAIETNFFIRVFICEKITSRHIPR